MLTSTDKALLREVRDRLQGSGCSEGRCYTSRRIQSLEDQLELAEASEADLMSQRDSALEEVEKQRAEKEYWCNRYHVLIERVTFSGDVLGGKFDPPTINELRKARGLEPL